MTSISNKNVTSESDEIDIGRLIGELIDHRKLIISITALFTLAAILYAVLSTPVYQANALIQVEQKQGNAILNSLSQVLPDAQPQSAPEIALLQSRMILGKTVDDLNLQIQAREKHLPLIGRGLARLSKDKEGEISISSLYLPPDGSDVPEIELVVKDNNHYTINTGSDSFTGTVGELFEKNKIKIKVDKIDAEPGTTFRVRYLTKLKAITDLQDRFSVSDQGKDTGMLNLSLTGEDPDLIAKILDDISNNYLAQNIARQAAQDAKSLEFLNKQLPQVRTDLDSAEGK
ncbi:TPA: Wzz/FepE/Etk N-terminal domain-containing protein, partial [Escherichia coli]